MLPRGFNLVPMKKERGNHLPLSGHSTLRLKISLKTFRKIEEKKKEKEGENYVSSPITSNYNHPNLWSFYE